MNTKSFREHTLEDFISLLQQVDSRVAVKGESSNPLEVPLLEGFLRRGLSQTAIAHNSVKNLRGLTAEGKLLKIGVHLYATEHGEDYLIGFAQSAFLVSVRGQRTVRFESLTEGRPASLREALLLARALRCRGSNLLGFLQAEQRVLV